MLRTFALAFCLLPACALSHHAPASTCGAPPLDEPSLDEAQRQALFDRLRHEVTHVADTITNIAAGTHTAADAWTITEDGAWTITEDGGSMTVSGELAEQEGATVFVAEIAFAHFTGRHGGWGLSALEGRACVTITVQRGGARTVEVSAAIGLVEDGPLEGAPTATAWYIEEAGEVVGQVGGVSLSD